MDKRLDRLRIECTKAKQGKTAACAPLVAGLRRTAWLAAVLAGLALVGCASLSADSAQEAKQKVVGERAEARWQALMKGDLDAAYAFLSPASKKATPLMEYARTIKPGMWRQVKVDKVDCEAEICKAQLSVTYDSRMMKGITTPVWETWVIEQGSAWYVYR